MSRRLQTALRAARAAGKVLRERFEDAREIRYKGKRDIVTDADHAADRAARAAIRARFPHDRFLSEEDDAATRAALWAQSEAADAPLLWIVDPLDGTTNYARRVPIFSVSLALFHRGAVQLGVVYDPLRDEMFAAERGRGAFLNGTRLAVSRTRVFTDAVIGLEWGRAPRRRERTMHALARIAARAMTMRTSGSAALSLCYVAAARLDAYFHFSLSPWDVAAAALIIEEAGGRVTTPAGAAWNVHSQAYVASNGQLHATMLKFFYHLC